MNSLSICNVSVVDVLAGKTIGGQKVIVRGDKISEISSQEFPRQLENGSIDGSNRYLSPGLIDTHVHFFLDGSNSPRQNFIAANDSKRLAVARFNAEVALRSGITTMRDLAAPGELMFRLRREIDCGDVLGPHVLCCGYAIMRPRGHCYWLGGIEVTTKKEMREAVLGQFRKGGDYVKLMASGGGLTPGTLPHEADLDVALMREAVEVASDNGSYVTAHCHATESIERAIDAELSMIEHATFAEPPGVYRYNSEIASRIRDAGIVVVPTVFCALKNANKFEQAGKTYNPDDVGAVERLRGRFVNTKLFHRIGVSQIAGTDCGAIDAKFDTLVDELLTYVQAGFSTAEALRSATSLAAEHIRLKNVGEIKEGSRADLVLLDRDPLEDLDCLRFPNTVIKAGKVVFDKKIQV